MNRKTKTQCERAHAKRRCLERYGEAINRHDIQAIVGLIQSGDTKKARIVERQSLRVSVWIIKFREKEMKVVYDRNRKTIVSFLPMEDRVWPSHQTEA